jgi:putative ABC transport system permease protein
MSNFYIAGRPDPPISELPIADQNHVSLGYFDLIGLRMEAGRAFNDERSRDYRKGAQCCSHRQSAFARQFFPNENPVGQRLLDSDKKQSSQIVGVVADYRPMGVENGTRATIFWPDLRQPAASLVVRSSASNAALATALRDLVWSLDRNLPPPKCSPWPTTWTSGSRSANFTTFLLGGFAALALILGMLGIYGVLAGLVASRVREIGIRMAIGATPGQIGGLVLSQGMLPVAVGLVAGLAAAMALGRFLESLLFQVKPRDPLTLSLALAAVLLVSPLAVWVPLRRATRVDCTVALREE